MFQNDYLRLSRPLIRKFNLNTAVMLSEIYSEYTYWNSQNKLEQGGWFFSTVENIYNNTGLSKHQQLSACKELESYGIIKIKYQGLPKKRYFKFDSTLPHKDSPRQARAYILHVSDRPRFKIRMKKTILHSCSLLLTRSILRHYKT